MMIVREVSARTSRAGDRFVLEVIQPVTIDGKTVISAGARAWGEIVEAEPAGRNGRGGRIAMRLLYVESDVGQIRMDGTSEEQRRNSSRNVTALSASVGPFALLAKGNEARLKAGEIVTGFVASRTLAQEASQEPTAVIAADTSIDLVTIATISSETASRGDILALVTGSDVTAGERVVIPKGTRAYGRITVADRKGAFGVGGRLAVEPLYIDLAGRAIRLSGEKRSEGRNAPLRGVSRSAFTGAIAVAVTGRRAEIVAGTRLTSRLQRDEVFPPN